MTPTQTQHKKLLSPIKSGEGECKECYEAEAAEIQHFGGGFGQNCQSVPDSFGTLGGEEQNA